MSSDDVDLHEFHWMMDMFQSIDVGIIVVDRDYRVKVWNADGKESDWSDWVCPWRWASCSGWPV